MLDNVTALQNATTDTTSTSKDKVKKNTDMDKDDFLKLFVEQLKNQDPMNPMDNYEVAAQLAQYSSLEQLVNLNSSFENFMKQSAQNAYFQGISLIGKEVDYVGDKFTFDPEKDDTLKIKFKLDSPSRKVNVNIYDENGNFVRNVILDDAESGENSVEWDGFNTQGNKASKGIYKYDIVAYNDEGEEVSYTPYGHGIINSITYDKDNSETNFKVNGETIDISNIVNVTTNEDDITNVSGNDSGDTNSGTGEDDSSGTNNDTDDTTTET